jgi:hypothetical protein
MNQYKVGDLFAVVDNENVMFDIGEITVITENDVQYRWLGVNGSPSYSFIMPRKDFALALKSDYSLLPCNSEQQKLAILLKYV